MIWRGVMTPEHAIYGSDATALLGGTAVALLIPPALPTKGTARSKAWSIT
jgi:hypothetical protein